MGKNIRFRLFLVVIFIFIGAVIFISEPFTNNQTRLANTVSSVTAEGSVIIEDEAVATAIPPAVKSDSRWGLLAVAVTVINLAGAIAIVIMTSRDTVQV